MSKITLEVDNKDIQTVLLILNNLKMGLIKNIESDKKLDPKTRYQPKTNKVIYENEQMGKSLSGKYMNAASFKSRSKK